MKPVCWQQIIIDIKYYLQHQTTLYHLMEQTGFDKLIRWKIAWCSLIWSEEARKYSKICNILISALLQIQDNHWPWRLVMLCYDEWLLSYVIINVRRMDLPCVQFPGHFNLLLSSRSMNHWITNAWPNTYWNKVVVLVLWTDDSDNNTLNTSETNIVVY